MSDILLFMYQGEVNVRQENLANFLKTAELLQIKGLTEDESSVSSIYICLNFYQSLYFSVI